MIKKEFNRLPREHTVVWFARQLNCDRRNIYDIFERRSIDIELLARISTVLNHDFFADLSKQLNLPGPSECETQTHIV